MAGVALQEINVHKAKCREHEHLLQQLRLQQETSTRVIQDMAGAMSELQHLALRRAQAAKCGFDCVRAALKAFGDDLHEALDNCFQLTTDGRSVKETWKPLRAQRIVGVLDADGDARPLHKLIYAQVEAIANLMHAAERGELDAVPLNGAVPDGQTFCIQTLDSLSCKSITSFRQKAKRLLATTLLTALTQPIVRVACAYFTSLRAVTQTGIGGVLKAVNDSMPDVARITDELAWKNAARATKRSLHWIKTLQ